MVATANRGTPGEVGRWEGNELFINRDERRCATCRNCDSTIKKTKPTSRYIHDTSSELPPIGTLLAVGDRDYERVVRLTAPGTATSGSASIETMRQAPGVCSRPPKLAQHAGKKALIQVWSSTPICIVNGGSDTDGRYLACRNAMHFT